MPGARQSCLGQALDGAVLLGSVHNIVRMTEPKASDDRVDQFIIYASYGEVMHRFQTFELLLWQFLVRGIKRGSSLAQAMDKITKWDQTTAGAIVRGLKSQAHWPDGTIESLEEAVDTRNYLAHHFLREYFMVTPSEEVRSRAAEQLANVSVRLENLQEALEAHLRSLGVTGIEDLDEETRAEVDKLRPAEWLG